MSADDIATLSTAQLLDLFAAGARQVEVGRRTDAFHKRLRLDPLKLLEPSEPRDWPAVRKNMEEGLRTLYAAGGALRARGAISEIKRLFADQDPDIRFCAMMLFEDIDPELASSATHSFSAQLPTTEVADMRRRARQAPADKSLPELFDDALIARFEDAARREHGSHLLDPIDAPEDQETCDRINDEVLRIMRELKARRLLPRLKPLLESPNMSVRFRAAQACLRSAEQEALAALKSVIANGDFEETVAARETLADWRKGNCLVDGL